MDVPLVMQKLDLKNYSDSNNPEIRHTEDLQPGELKTSYNVLTKALYGKHITSITPEMLAQLPQRLSNPVMMLHSSPDSTNSKGIVAVIQLQDKKGAPVIVSFGVEPHIKDDGGIYYSITSIYGKTERPDSDIPYPKWIQDQINRGRLLYYDDTQIPEWERQNSFKLNLSVVKSKAPARGGLGPIPKSLVRGQGLYTHNVLTRADFVNAQNENPNSYQLGRATGTSLPPVDVAAIRARVKGAEVTELGGGRVRVAFPNGHTWLVDTRGGEIKPNAKSVRRDYGRDVEPEDVVLGRTRIIGGQTFIDIVGGMTDASTFSHEALEAAWDLLTKEEQGKLRATYKSRENAAERYAEFLEDRLGKTTKATQRIFQRIKDFFAGLRAAFFGKNSEDIFREVATGKMWGRSFKDAKRAASYKRAADALKEIISSAEEGTIRNARGDISNYGGTNDVTLVWGDGKKGLAHIGNKRGPEVVGNVIRTILDGDVAKFVASKKTLHITWNGYEAVLSLDEHGKNKTWLLTGWGQNKPDAIGEVGTQSNATQNGPTFSRADLGAGLDMMLKQGERLVNGTREDSEHYRLERRQKPAPVEAAAPDDSAVVEKNAQWLRDAGTAQLERVVRPSHQNESLKDKLVHVKNNFYRQWFDKLDPLKKHFGKDVYFAAENAIYGAASRAERRFERGDPKKGVKGLVEIMQDIPA